jgi:hypothetical protein
MTSTRGQFSVGDFQCIAIKDGTFPYPSDWFFSNVPKAQLGVVVVALLVDT